MTEHDDYDAPPGEHGPLDHDACCYLPGGCEGGCHQPGGCADPGYPPLAMPVTGGQQYTSPDGVPSYPPVPLPAKRTDRLSQVTTDPLAPGSLVGSFFHADAGRQWQGCVVAEPAPGVYLVELFEWFTGGSNFQQLVRITDMDGWQFYDDIEWMRNTYEYGRVPWGRRPAVPEPAA